MRQASAPPCEICELLIQGGERTPEQVAAQSSRVNVFLQYVVTLQYVVLPPGPPWTMNDVPQPHCFVLSVMCSPPGGGTHAINSCRMLQNLLERHCPDLQGHCPDLQGTARASDLLFYFIKCTSAPCSHGFRCVIIIRSAS